MRFVKMQGLGNDYIYVNCFEEIVHHPEELAVRLSRKHFGIGADGLVLIEPADGADAAMRIFNADGSEAEMCGNALRCIGKYLYEREICKKTEILVETKGGIKRLELAVEGDTVTAVTVDMGSPELSPRKIPVLLPGECVLEHRFQVLGQTLYLSCVNMGNPHAVFFVRDPEAIDTSVYGSAVEHNPIFPERTNVEFVRVVDRKHLQMRVWERGSGETLACGTGACAALVAAVLTGKCDRTAEVKLQGGTLKLHWDAADNHVYQQGAAEIVFDGEINL